MNDERICDREADARPASRIEWLDAAKFFAMAFILVCHTYGFNDWRFSHAFYYYIDVFTLPVFWIGAGFTAKPDFSLRRRFMQLMLPYFTISAICLLWCLQYHPDTVTRDTLFGIIYGRFSLMTDMPGFHDRLMTICNAPLWFLPSMFTGYMLLKLIFRFRTLKAQGVAAAAMFAVTFLFPYIPVLLPWSLDTAFFIAPLMWTGYLMRRKGLFSDFSWKLLVISAAIYFIALPWGEPCGFYVRDFGEYYPGCLVTSLAGVTACFEIFLLIRGSRLVRFFSRINRRALWIYGFQILFFDMIFTLIPGVTQYLWGTLLIGFQALVAIAGGWCAASLPAQVKRIRFPELPKSVRR